MKRTLLAGALVLVSSLPASAAASDPRVVATKLELLRRILPDDASVAAGLDGLQRAAERAARVSHLRLEAFSTSARQVVASDSLGSVPVDLSAVLRAGRDPQATGDALGAFVDAFLRSPRLLLLDELRIESQPGATVRLSASVRLPFYVQAPPGLMPDALLAAKIEAIERLQQDAAWPLRRLSTLRRNPTPPLFLTALTLDKEALTASGVAPWPGLAREWAPLVEVEATSLEWSQPDACQHFTVEARFRKPAAGSAGGGEADAKGPAFVTGSGVEDRCATSSTSAPPLPPVKTSGHGPLALRGRDLDLAEVVLLLARASGQAVVVGDDVAGRVSVDLRDVTLDEAFGALEPLGVFASPPARIRRVVRGRRPEALPLPAGSGAPVNFWFKRARLEDVFALLADISGDGVLVPKPPLPSVSVSAVEVPWDTLYEAVAASAGLTLRHESGLYRAERAGLTPADLVAAVGREGEGRSGIEAVLADQLELQALTSAGKGWSAWMVTPRGSLLEYQAGTRFFDGQVTSVGPDAVELRIEIADPLSAAKFRTRRIEFGSAF